MYWQNICKKLTTNVSNVLIILQAVIKQNIAALFNT